MRYITLIAATLLLSACDHKEAEPASESKAVAASTPAPSSLVVQSSGSIHHINQRDLEAVRRRGHEGDTAAVEQLIDYYMFSANDDGDDEILRNLTRWLDKGVSLGVAGADQKLLAVASERSGPPCTRIRQIVESLAKEVRSKFPQSTYVRACLAP